MRIFIVSSYGWWGKFDPSDLYERTNKDYQIGGGETAMLQISRYLAEAGNEVVLFYDTDRPRRIHGIDFMPTKTFIDMVTHMEHDVLISWDEASVFRFATMSKVNVLAYQLNDPHVGVYDWVIDMYMHPSEWHAARTRELCPELTPSKQRVYLTNGVDFGRYIADPAINKELKRVVYTSSPDRGLHHLLRIWPEIVSREPEATLHIFYDHTKWLAMEKRNREAGLISLTSDRSLLLSQQLASLPKNVFVHGGVNQHILADEQLKSCIMAYPCDPVRPTEGFSMSILEGITAGCHVITTDADALGELWAKAPGVTILPLPIQDDIWINTIVDKLRSNPLAPQYSPKFAWATLAGAWERELLLCLRSKHYQPLRL